MYIVGTGQSAEEPSSDRSTHDYHNGGNWN